MPDRSLRILEQLLLLQSAVRWQAGALSTIVRIRSLQRAVLREATALFELRPA
jgi:hypothetical protein